MERYKVYQKFVGIPTFFRSPVCEDFDKVDADVAFLGVPYDVGVGYRPGCRLGPRDIRTYSPKYGGLRGQAGYWDITTDKQYLRDVRMVDCGDADIVYYDQEQNFSNITECVRALLHSGCLPVLIGGDHSVTYPIVQAFEEFSPLSIVHFDAHMDWNDAVGGVRYANGSPLRRVGELSFVGQISQLGVRAVRNPEDAYRNALSRGNLIVTRDQIRREGVLATLDRIPPMKYIYVTIDIDAFDPSIAPGTGSPEVDGLLYHELRGMLQILASKGKVVGFDFVEVNPLLDTTGQTSLLASTVILEFLGAIFDQPR